MRKRLIPLIIWDISFSILSSNDLIRRLALRAVSPENPMADHELFALLVIYAGVIAFSLLYTFLELEHVLRYSAPSKATTPAAST